MSRSGAGAGIRRSSSDRVETMLLPRQKSPKVESSNAGSRKSLPTETWHLRLRGPAADQPALDWDLSEGT